MMDGLSAWRRAFIAFTLTSRLDAATADEA
jgi:hypothetical protein